MPTSTSVISNRPQDAIERGIYHPRPLLLPLLLLPPLLPMHTDCMYASQVLHSAAAEGQLSAIAATVAGLGDVDAAASILNRPFGGVTYGAPSSSVSLFLLP